LLIYARQQIDQTLIQIKLESIDFIMIRSTARKGLLTFQALVCLAQVLAEGKLHCVLTVPDPVLRSDFGFVPRSDTDYLAIDASD
jgi:hypothetical protein